MKVKRSPVMGKWILRLYMCMSTNDTISIFVSSDMKCSATIPEVLKDHEGLYHALSAHLNESLKDGSQLVCLPSHLDAYKIAFAVLKDLKLRTEIPIDSEGHTQFPTISDFEDVSRSQLRQVYEDFMMVIWCQSCILVC